MKKILKPISLILFGSLMTIVGFYSMSYMVVYMEMNDRLKHEAAFAKGHYKVLSALEEGDVEKAKRIASFYVDAHFLTLSEYRYLQSSLSQTDIDIYLCEVAQYKLNNVEVDNEEAKNEIIELSQQIIDNGC